MLTFTPELSKKCAIGCASILALSQCTTAPGSEVSFGSLGLSMSGGTVSLPTNEQIAPPKGLPYDTPQTMTDARSSLLCVVNLTARLWQLTQHLGELKAESRADVIAAG